MQDDIRLDDLFERGAKSRHEHGGQIRDEAHGIGQHDPCAVRQAKRPQRRVKRRKKHVLREDVCARQAIEQGRLAGIGVADERDNGERDIAPAAAMQAARFLHPFEVTLDAGDAFLDEASVGFDLGLAGTAEKAETAPLALQMGP